MRSKKSFMVEFSGTPEAGKSTAIKNASIILENSGYKTMILKESAESLPEEIPKGTFEANLWMHFITQAGILKAEHTNADIVLIDRGIIDSKFYGWKYLKEQKCSLKQYNEFLECCLKRINPDLFLAFSVSPNTAMLRRGGEGRLINRQYLEKYNQLFMIFFEDINVKKKLIKTDDLEIWQMSNLVANIILNAIL